MYQRLLMIGSLDAFSRTGCPCASTEVFRRERGAAALERPGSDHLGPLIASGSVPGLDYQTDDPDGCGAVPGPNQRAAVPNGPISEAGCHLAPPASP
jgi:hypothetical protein